MVHPDVDIEPNMENHKKYEKIFAKYLKLYENLAEMMEMDD